MQEQLAFNPNPNSNRYAEGVAAVQEQLALLAEEGIDAPAAVLRASYDAYQACSHDGDGDGALLWLRRVLVNTELSDLGDSKSVVDLRGEVQRMERAAAAAKRGGGSKGSAR